jgi:hypothetical protein
MEDPNNILIIFGLITGFLIGLKAWTTFVFILKLKKENESKDQ